MYRNLNALTSKKTSTNVTDAHQGFYLEAHTVETLFYYIESFVFIVSIITFAFFMYQRQKQRCDWELIYIAFFEALADAAHLYFGTDLNSAIYVTLANGATINWCRYVLWLACHLPLDYKTHFRNVPS
jgi:hypothetical protein